MSGDFAPARRQPTLVEVGIVFESAIGVIGCLLGWLLGVPPWQSLHWNLADFGLALAYTAPMVALFFAMLRWPIGPLQKIREILQEFLMAFGPGATVFGLFLLSVCAGFGEELLFRGFVQGYAAGKMGPWLALVLASLLFGAAHWVTTAYAVITAVLGLYFGWVWMHTGNLLVPIVMHALYDFVALAWLIKVQPSALLPPPVENAD